MSLLKLNRLFCILFLFAVIGLRNSFPQDTSTSLSTAIVGTVKDPQGAVVANAIISLIGKSGPPKSTATNDQGNYDFRGLPADTYVVTISVTGFADYKSSEITLVSGQTISQDVNLTLAGAVKQVTDVVADAPRVESEEPTVSNTLDSKELLGYQTNGRIFTQLLALAPGVSNQTGQDEGKTGVQGSASFSVNGGRTEYNSYLMDGSDLLNTGFNGSVNTLLVYPSLDAVGEMKVLTSNYGAMYGRTASGIVLLSTKSGGQDFHGDGYLFIRNEKLNARNFFDETKGAPLYRRADMGWTLGGPLYIPGHYNQKKDKTFFFFSEEYRNEKSPSEFNQGVPSAAERAGNFNDVCPSASQLIPTAPGPGFVTAQFPDCPEQPQNTTLTPVNGKYVQTSVPFTNNQLFDNITTSLNRNAATILGTGIIPLPNSNSGCNSTINSCYVSTVSVPTHWHQELFRIDHYFTENNRLLVRFVHDSWSTVTPTPQFGFVQNNFPTIENSFVGPGVAKVARFSQTLSPTLLNEVFFSYTNSAITLTDTNGQNAQWQRPAGLDAPCQLVQGFDQCPIGSIFNNGSASKIPGLVFQGGAAYGGGFGVDAGYMPWYHSNPVYSFGDSMSKQWGKHFLHFGSEFLIYNRVQNNSVSGAATGDTQGILTYAARDAIGPFNTGNAFANFLLETSANFNPSCPTQSSCPYPTGNVAISFQQDSTQRTYHQRYEIAEPYIQDDWKLSPRFTLNLGLRVSLFSQYHELNNSVYNFEPSAFNKVLAGQIQIDPLNGFLESSNGTPNLDNSTASNQPIILDPNHIDPHLINGLVRCGSNGVPSTCQSSRIFNPAPRVGFAWDPTGSGKTSIRGGYGIFFEHGTGNEANTGALEGSAPLVLSATASSTDVSCIGNSLCSAQTAFQNAAYPLNVTSIPNKTVWPYAQQWSFGIQRELDRNTIAGVAYVGSKGTHLTAERQINQIPAVAGSQNPYGPNQPFVPSDCTLQANPNNPSVDGYLLSNGAFVNPGTPASLNLLAACGASTGQVNAVRPYFGLAQIISLSNIADSSYNSFQATLHHQQGGLSLALSYTYSHSLDDSSDRFDPVLNASDVRANWASSNFDQRHLLNVSYIYNLPFLKWTRLAGPSAGWQKDLLDGWQISGITTFQTGSPFTVINGGINGAGIDNAGVANGLGIGSYPDVIGNPYAKPPAGGNNGSSVGPLLLNPAAFVEPRGLTFGDAGRNSLNNPNRTNFDISLFRNFRVSESQSVQVRAEAFNIFNNTQFEIYNPARGNQPNNEITCYGGPASGYSAAGGDGSNCLTGSAFLHPIDAHRPRTLQLAVKFIF